MTQQEFLEKNVFIDFKNLNENFEENQLHYFSEEDFEKVLEKAEYYGLTIYTMDTIVDGVSNFSMDHTRFHKKATDPKWYKKAFLTYKNREKGLIYTATYKVSAKLLAR